MADDMLVPRRALVDGRFAAISPQTPSVKRKIMNSNLMTPVPKSGLTEISSLVASPLASKSTRYVQIQLYLSSETPFAQRREPGALLQTLNQQIELPDIHSTGEIGQIPFTVNVDMKKFAFRTMHQSLMTASEGCCSHLCLVDYSSR